MGIPISGNRFLITGGLSLIGSHIAEHLLSAGAAEVVLFDNLSLSTPQSVGGLLEQARVRFVRGDILNADELMAATQGMGGVFAVAGYLTLPMSQNPPTGLRVNVNGLLNVLEACRWSGVQKAIFSSSVATAGNVAAGHITEETPYHTSGLQPASALYGITKLLGEQLCRLYAQRHGVDTVSLRYATVYGERQHYRGVNALYIVDTYDKIVAGQRPRIPGDGSEVHDYVYVGDVARANLMAMEAQASGESCLVATGISTNINDIVRILLQQCGSKLKPEYGEDTAAVKSAASSDISFSNEKARRLLGWTPQVSIEEGVRRLIAWRRAAG
ncbi:MAG: NAD-dependent epimerase/dehydratase family protein [Candidatus Lambdaproteobacteria bacterium]|nr:NAD-dependent epimerase/dehydratase family protein [Candidatus Lambdaproteobacteria bacterium]